MHKHDGKKLLIPVLNSKKVNVGDIEVGKHNEVDSMVWLFGCLAQ